eukprot:15327190-Ditylum_brightwellii.AAC.1
MQKLAAFGYRGYQVAMLNRCRIYMQVTTLSNFTSGDKTFIPKLFLDGVYHKAPSPYQWPPHARPAQPYWRLWYEAITLTFNLDKHN